ncbi:uncharacterized protein LOC113859552 [Abrus precatorius]|uniref:Uncharacterized protein LOC113859552 n=1 Tax=Abrus precatorius TaxID=3816 RepID=A0A8B8KVW9_ABRPR|nr:uncharacterized protein LOC113859552 [Abrus precatorius]
MQLETFYDGMSPATRTMIDAASGGSLNTKSLEEAQRIIEMMASSMRQNSNSRHSIRSGGYEAKILETFFAENSEKESFPRAVRKAKRQILEEANQPIDEEKYNRLSYPQRMSNPKQEKQFERFLDVFKKFQINISFAEVLEQMPSYAKFMKELLSKKRKLENDKTVPLTEECSAILQRKLPKILKDLGSFSIPCSIRNCTVEKALCDLGTNIYLMPLAIMKKLGIEEVKPTSITLQLANKSYTYPHDFVILDMEVDVNIPLILGRLFLATGRALIDVQKGELMLRVQD